MFTELEINLRIHYNAAQTFHGEAVPKSTLHQRKAETASACIGLEGPGLILHALSNKFNHQQAGYFPVVGMILLGHVWM